MFQTDGTGLVVLSVYSAHWRNNSSQFVCHLVRPERNSPSSALHDNDWVKTIEYYGFPTLGRPKILPVHLALVKRLLANRASVGAGGIEAMAIRTGQAQSMAANIS